MADETLEFTAGLDYSHAQLHTALKTVLSTIQVLPGAQSALDRLLVEVDSGELRLDVDQTGVSMCGNRLGLDVLGKLRRGTLWMQPIDDLEARVVAALTQRSS